MTMNKARTSDQSGSSRSVMVATLDKADDLLESLGEHVMTLGDTVDEDILTGLVADISEVWTPGCWLLDCSCKMRQLAKCH